MLCRFLIALLALSLTTTSAFAQVNGFGANAFNGNAFGGNAGGLGNAGGFATGGGLSNATTNSTYFGSTAVGSVRTYGGFSNGGYGIPYLSGPVVGGIDNSGLGSVYGAPGLAGVNGALPFGVGTGMFPPNVAAELFSGQLPLTDTFGRGLGNGDFGTSLNAAAVNSGGFGFPGLSYPGMMTPGMVPNGMMFPNAADFGGLNTSVQGATPAARPPVAKPTVKAAGDLADRSGNSAAAGVQENTLPTRRRLAALQDDGIPRSTVTATRIQNRLNNLKSPNLTAVKVLMAGRTATLSGTVDSKEDEALAIRLVGLEPGVVQVKSELQLTSAQ